MNTPHTYTCRGCGKEFTVGKEPVVSINLGKIARTRGRTLYYKEKPSKPTWGFMHLRCFLVLIGDPQSIEMISKTS